MTEPRVRFAVYGEIDMNLIDGSSVWLQSVCTMLTSLPGVEVTVLLRAAERRDLLTGPLRANPSIRIVAPQLDGARVLAPEAAAVQLEQLDREARFDYVLLRGSAVADAAIARGALRSAAVDLLRPAGRRTGERRRRAAPSPSSGGRPAPVSDGGDQRAGAGRGCGAFTEAGPAAADDPRAAIARPRAPPTSRRDRCAGCSTEGSSLPSTSLPRWWPCSRSCGTRIPSSSFTSPETRCTTRQPIRRSRRQRRPP